MDHYILDKNNEIYLIDLVETTTTLDAYIIWKQGIVGRIQCLIHPYKELEIANIEIFEHPLMPRNGCLSLRPFHRPKRNFRQLGLGSSMLEFIIVQAERLGMESIYGEVIPDDASKTPYLIEWYERHGFVIGNKPKRLSGALATIYYKFNSSNRELAE